MRFLYVQYHPPSVNPAKINSLSVTKTKVRVRPRVRVGARARARVRVGVRVRARLRLGRSPHWNDATKTFKRMLQKLKEEVKLKYQPHFLLIQNRVVCNPDHRRNLTPINHRRPKLTLRGKGVI